MKLIRTGKTAHMLGVSSEYVRKLEESGILRAAIRAEDGTRLFDMDVVKKYAAERQAKKQREQAV